MSGLLDNLKSAQIHDNAGLLTRPRGFRTDRIVDVIEFVESKEYFGDKGQVWNAVKDNLWQIFHKRPTPFEIVLTGAAGSAKSTTTWISFGYILYLPSNLWDPHLEFGMMPGSTIFLVFQSIRLHTTEDALFDRLKRNVDQSPYFNRYFPRKKSLGSKLIFPNNIVVMPLTGSTDAGLGKDIFAAAITEINFMPIVKGSVRLTNSDKTARDVGSEMYNIIRNRIQTRFARLGGGFPGKLIIDSSRNYPGDFTDRKVAEARLDPDILIINRTLWDAKAHEYPPTEPRFLVEIGNEHRPPRIIERHDEAEDEDHILEVPARHKKDFITDIEQALKDLAGLPGTYTGRFIPYPDKIALAQQKYVEETGRQNLFKVTEISLNDLFGVVAPDQSVDWDLLIDYGYIESILETDHIFAMHTDLALTTDACGFAVGRIVGSRTIKHGRVYHPSTGRLVDVDNFEAPVYMIDGALCIRACPGDEIDLNLVRDLGLELAQHLNIRYGSADWTQSAALLQGWRARGIITGHVSVDRNPTAYYELKHAIREERLLLATNSVLTRELCRLKRIIRNGAVKVDHPDGPCESKDVSDAVAGVIMVLNNDRRPCGGTDGDAPENVERPGTVATASSRRKRTSFRHFG